MLLDPHAQLSVVLIEAHTIVRQGVRRLLEEVEGVTVLGDAGEAEAGLALAESMRPTVVCLGLDLPGLGGFEALRRLAGGAFRPGRVVLTHYDEPMAVRSAVEAGAQGYVVKDDTFEAYVAALRIVSLGGTYLSERVRGYETSPALTARERQVLALLALGLTSHEIGDRLGISRRTAEYHRAYLMQKLDLHDTASLTKFALRAGLTADAAL